METDGVLVFPESMTSTIEVLKELRRKRDEWRYFFIPNEEYSKITDPIEAGKIYWTEMLARTHIVALTSMFRTIRWFESLEDMKSNYYGFCASLRGLIESVADSFYTLQKVPLTIAIDFEVIRKQLEKTSIVLTTHEMLENELLHYIQATKIPRESKSTVPKHYNAKKVVEYLASISDGSNIFPLYNHLCSIAHPAYESGTIFLFLHEGETIVSNDSIKLERAIIANLLEEASETLEMTFRIFMNNILSTTSLLNEFGIEAFRTDLIGEQEFRVTEIWKEVEELKKKSVQKYHAAEMTGIYK